MILRTIGIYPPLRVNININILLGNYSALGSVLCLLLMKCNYIHCSVHHNTG
jgi:hypothetical protein